MTRNQQWYDTWTQCWPNSASSDWENKYALTGTTVHFGLFETIMDLVLDKIWSKEKIFEEAADNAWSIHWAVVRQNAQL